MTVLFLCHLDLNLLSSNTCEYDILAMGLCVNLADIFVCLMAAE